MKTCDKCGRFVWVHSIEKGKKIVHRWSIHWKSDALPNEDPCENSAKEVMPDEISSSDGSVRKSS